MSSSSSNNDQPSCCPKNPVEIVMMDEGGTSGAAAAASAASSHEHEEDELPLDLNVDPKENLKLRPKKSILKSTSSFDNERKLSQTFNREAHFDEMNILATFHPADKDYGHMKVDEPKTPYHHHSESESEEGPSEGVRRVSLSEPTLDLDPKELEERLKKKLQRNNSPSPGGAGVEDFDDDDDGEESEEKAAKRKAFEMKRKQHYNEFQAVKLAKQLIEEDEQDLATHHGARSSKS